MKDDVDSGALSHMRGGTPSLTAYGVRNDVPGRLRGLLSLADFELAARRTLPRPLFGYIAGAAEDGASYAANRAAFEQLKFRPAY